jgi:hypothetical protein
MTVSNNNSILKKSQNSDNENSIISNIYHNNDAPRKSITSNFSNTSSIHISTNNRSTSIPKRNKKKRSEIQELVECEDKFTNSEISEDDAESSEEEDPHISKYIRDINSITVINIPNIPERKKEEEEGINTNGQIIIQNFYNSNNNNVDFSYVRNNSNTSRDSFYSQTDNNPFRISDTLPFTRKQNSVKVIEHVQSPERINKEANRERFDNYVKNKNKKKVKSGKMHTKFSKKKRNKYFTNNDEEN